MVALASLVFFTTCRGAFGLEPLVGATGPGWAIVLILVTPLMWSLPISLMVAELAGLMPEEGGYYVRVRETLGQFWGVQAGWWAMAYAIGVMAIFPVLFGSYLSFFFPSLGTSADGAHPGTVALMRWLVAVLMIALAMAVNLRSAKDVGRTAKAGAAFVLGAFLVMIVVWLSRSADPGAVVGVVRRTLRRNTREHCCWCCRFWRSIFPDGTARRRTQGKWTSLSGIIRGRLWWRWRCWWRVTCFL